MRSVALFLVLLLSGLPAAAGGALPGTETQEACGGCPGESPEPEDTQCSPVCHDCVCSLGARTLQPPTALLSAPEPRPIVASGQRWSACAAPPRAPALAGVFHPPRA